jgi:hypothetical protein
MEAANKAEALLGHGAPRALVLSVRAGAFLKGALTGRVPEPSIIRIRAFLKLP